MEKIQSEGDEWHQVLFLGDGRDVLNDSIQNIMGKSTRCKSVVLGRFYDVFMVMNQWLEFFLDDIHKFGCEPDIGFQKVRQELVCSIRLFLQVVEMSLVQVLDVDEEV